MTRFGKSVLFAGALLQASLLPGSLSADCGNGRIEAEETCDDGNTFGGDGCAANCTEETVRVFRIDPDRSMALTQFRSLIIPLRLEGTLRFTMGHPGPDGTIPFVIRKEDVGLHRIAVPGLACVCVRSDVASEDFHFGPGNAGGGQLGCGEAGLFGADYLFRQHHSLGVVGRCTGEESDALCNSGADCPAGSCFTVDDCAAARGTVEGPDSPHPGVCNGPQELAISGQGPRGTMQIVDNIGFTLIFDGGGCDRDPDDPAKGPDGEPCTEDDPGQAPGRNVPATTGRAETLVVHADNELGALLGVGENCGDEPCVASVQARRSTATRSSPMCGADSKAGCSRSPFPSSTTRASAIPWSR